MQSLRCVTFISHCCPALRYNTRKLCWWSSYGRNTFAIPSIDVGRCVGSGQTLERMVPVVLRVLELRPPSSDPL